jgi:hypothetical protein
MFGRLFGRKPKPRAASFTPAARLYISPDRGSTYRRADASSGYTSPTYVWSDSGSSDGGSCDGGGGCD